MTNPTLLTQTKGNISLPTPVSGNYSIVEAQLPLVGGLGGHNLLVVKDPNGNVIGELDGLATGIDGSIKPIGNLSTDTLKVYETAGSYLWSPSEAQATVFTGSYSQVATLWDTAAGCGAAINNRNLPYPWMGLGSNSNSVASTLDACLGVTEPSSVAKNATFTPGVGTLLLDPATIANEQQLNGAQTTTTPQADRITGISSSGSTETIQITAADGSTQVDTVGPGANGQSSTSEQKTFNASGALVSDETITMNSDGSTVVAASGSGLTLAVGSNASCSITGSSDIVNVAGTGTNVQIGGNGFSGADDIVNMDGGTVNVLGSSHVDIYGHGISATTGNSANVYINDDAPSRAGINGGMPGSPNYLSAGSGDQIKLDGLGTTNVTGSGSQISVNPTADPDFITGTGNTLALNNYAYVNLSDGANDSISGAGYVTGSYGLLNVGNSSNLSIYGNSEQATGNSTDQLAFDGLGDSFVGTGATLTPYSGTTLSVTGANTVDLNSSNVFLTGDSLTCVDNTSSLNGITIFGNNDSLTGSGTYDSFYIGGTYDTSSLGYNSNTYFGLTTGDSLSGFGSSSFDITSPDTYYFDPSFSIDDPVVLNLAGAKVSTQNLSNSIAYFDMQNRGTKVHTGWGTAGEGYLVYDPTNRNTVTNEQSLVSGFPAMQALDTNHDGILNSLDSTWASLKVWIDSAGNGTFVAGSLKTMDQMGIASISLHSTHLNQNQNNNTILDDSTFTWKTGGTGDIAGMDFNYHAASVQVSTPKPPPERCVHVASFLPDGRRASEVAEGSMLELADETSLERSEGKVTYSQRKSANGWRIVTVSGISLVCSDTAPIPTTKGLVKAPDLMEHSIAVRKDEGGSTLIGWEAVASVEPVGVIEVQHIFVGERCFWAGEKAGCYILHHNATKLPY
jgi:hypothetical protein